MQTPNGEDLIYGEGRSGRPESLIFDVWLDETGKVKAGDVVDVDIPRGIRYEAAVGRGSSVLRREGWRRAGHTESSRRSGRERGRSKSRLSSRSG